MKNVFMDNRAGLKTRNETWESGTWALEDSRYSKERELSKGEGLQSARRHVGSFTYLLSFKHYKALFQLQMQILEL